MAAGLRPAPMELCEELLKQIVDMIESKTFTASYKRFQRMRRHVEPSFEDFVDACQDTRSQKFLPLYRFVEDVDVFGELRRVAFEHRAISDAKVLEKLSIGFYQVLSMGRFVDKATVRQYIYTKNKMQIPASVADEPAYGIREMLRSKEAGFQRIEPSFSLIEVVRDGKQCSGAYFQQAKEEESLQLLNQIIAAPDIRAELQRLDDAAQNLTDPAQRSKEKKLLRDMIAPLIQELFGRPDQRYKILELFDNRLNAHKNQVIAFSLHILIQRYDPFIARLLKTAVLNNLAHPGARNYGELLELLFAYLDNPGVLRFFCEFGPEGDDQVRKYGVILQKLGERLMGMQLSKEMKEVLRGMRPETLRDLAGPRVTELVERLQWW